MKIKVECLFEVVANILHHLLLRRSGEARNGYCLTTLFALLVLTYKLADILIIHPEVLTPGGKTMRFVYYNTYNMACQQYLLYSFRSKHLRRNVQQ